jgi:hypothetical protein
MVGDGGKVETLNRPVSQYTGEFSFVSNKNIHAQKNEARGTIDAA